jgi:hypothetical protein
MSDSITQVVQRFDARFTKTTINGICVSTNRLMKGLALLLWKEPFNDLVEQFILLKRAPNP